MADIKIPGYTVGRKIGEGSFARIYECQQNETLRHYVLKVFVPSIGEDLVFSGVFHEILGKASSVVHPNLNSYVETGQVDLNYYVVTEKLNPWPDYLKGNGAERSDKLKEILRQIAWTLDFLWGKKLLHGGLRPENILFNDEGQPVITDLLVSSVLNSRRLKDSVNSLFKSPEQILGKGGVDCRSDIYCLGLVFYRMLTGHIAYIGASPIDIENKHLVEPVPKLPKQVSEFQPLLEGMMAKKIEERFQNWGEVLDAIGKYTGDEGAEASIQLQSEVDENGVQQEFELDAEFDENAAFDNEAGVMYDHGESKLDEILELVKQYKLYVIGGGVLVLALVSFFFIGGGDEEEFVPPVRPHVKKNVTKKAAEADKKKEEEKEDPIEIARRKAEALKKEAIKKAAEFKYKVIHIDDLIKSLKDNNYADKYYNSTGDYKNKYEKKIIKGDSVVIDKASGLMWMQDGSEDYYVYKDADKWTVRLREKGYAGFHDWRIPTFDEAATVLENKESAGGSLFIDPVFSGKQRYIWVGNKSAKKDHWWAVDFYGGDWNEVPDGTTAYVRLVRKLQ